MKPVFQTKRGLGGNCLAACLATIFEVSLESMPDLAPPECFADWTVQSKLKRQWLSGHGLDYLEIDLDGQAYHWTSGAIPAAPCLFAVKSPTPEMRAKGYGHFVVGKVREANESVEYAVLHDPLGALAATYEITAVGFFVPLNPHAIVARNQFHHANL